MAEHHDLSEESDGRVSRTEAGSYTLRRLSLNRPELIRFRVRRARIGARIENLRQAVGDPNLNSMPRGGERPSMASRGNRTAGASSRLVT